jgi:hypothetical protein
VSTISRSGSSAATGHDLLSWITATDHKRIGILYLSTSLLYFAVAGALGLAIRTQLARPNNQLISSHAYAQLFTLHGTAMIFLFAAPFAFGLGNFLIPLQIGAPDMAFPFFSARLRTRAQPPRAGPATRRYPRSKSARVWGKIYGSSAYSWCRSQRY